MEIITDETFKYNLKRLDLNAGEFEFIKEFFDLTIDPVGSFKEVCQIKDFCIYKVFENNPRKTEDKKSNNLMLFHGTIKESATGILKTGFKNSESGWFGKGVYMTECSDIAHDYSMDINADNLGGTRFFNYIFVNEVLESEKLQVHTLKGDPLEMDEDNTADLLHPFQKHVRPYSPQSTEEDYKKDLMGRKYRNKKMDALNKLDEFVADEKITIPRYLIALETGEKDLS